jgi:multicomponent Na+:H+ antiporter subunit B
MSKIIKIVSLTALSPIIIFGLYIISHGHLTPGGGFQGGVIIASAFVLVLVAFKNDIKLSHKLFVFFESLGLVFFIILAFLGIFKNTFLYNFLANSSGILGRTIQFGANTGCLNSGGVIPLMNLAIGIEVAAALSLVALFIIRHKDQNKTKYD